MKHLLILTLLLSSLSFAQDMESDMQENQDMISLENLKEVRNDYAGAVLMAKGLAGFGIIYGGTHYIDPFLDSHMVSRAKKIGLTHTPKSSLTKMRNSKIFFASALVAIPLLVGDSLLNVAGVYSVVSDRAEGKPSDDYSETGSPEATAQ